MEGIWALVNKTIMFVSFSSRAWSPVFWVVLDGVHDVLPDFLQVCSVELVVGCWSDWLLVRFEELGQFSFNLVWGCQLRRSLKYAQCLCQFLVL